MKRFLCLTLTLILLAMGLCSCSEPEHVAPTMEEIDFSTLSDPSRATVTEEMTDYVMIDVKDFGSIIIRLYPDVAPASVENFKKLVSEKFYDGLTFHRIIENFMIQGGDPDGDGTGNSDATVMGEFSSNGFENNLLHKRGVLSMARSTDPNSASCQFFIVHADSTHLDGDYAAFGYVVSGMDVVDQIAEVPTFKSNDRPYNTVTMSSIRFVTVPEDALTK